MLATTAALPALNLNSSLNAQDLLDLEVGFRSAFNFMLDAEETDRNMRDAGRNIIHKFLEELKVTDPKHRQILRDFIVKTNELFETATNRMPQVRATSAKCLVALWAERTRILSPLFQDAFFALKQLGASFPRPDLFEYGCFRALVKHQAGLPFLAQKAMKTLTHSFIAMKNTTFANYS